MSQIFTITCLSLKLTLPPLWLCIGPVFPEQLCLLSRIWGSGIGTSGICLSGSSWDYFGDSPTPKKRRIRLAPKMVQTWVDLFRNSIQIFSFCSSIEPSSRFFKPFPPPPQNSQPRLCFWRCRLSLFSSKDIGHMPRCRAHRERQSGSRRSPRLWHTESSRNSSTPPLEGLMASTLQADPQGECGEGAAPGWQYVNIWEE